MRERRFKRFSIRGPAVLFALVLVLAVTLTVLWNVALVHDYNRLRDLAAGGGAFHGALIAVGSALLLAIIVLSCILGIQLLTNLRWSQRQSNFLASVSHELNSPLTSIKLYAQTLRRDDLSASDRAGFVRKILFDTDRLSHIIANILRAAELDNRGEELRVVPEPVDLSRYVREYVDDARTIYAGKIEASFAAEGEARVAIDPIMFRQVLDNLFDNALRYRGDRPARVEVRVRGGEQRVELLVRDDGIGIRPEMLDNVFERFYRLEDGAAPQTGRKGMGIGLSVVRSIVRSHGGDVHAESEGRGRGTLIRIRLPALAQEPVRP